MQACPANMLGLILKMFSADFRHCGAQAFKSQLLWAAPLPCFCVYFCVCAYHRILCLPPTLPFLDFKPNQHYWGCFGSVVEGWIGLQQVINLECLHLQENLDKGACEGNLDLRLQALCRKVPPPER